MLSKEKKVRAEVDYSLSLDEGWWASLVADESTESAYNESIVVKKAPIKPDSMNWSLVQELFANDRIITLEAYGFNQGGLLVQREGIQGFVPVSHLINVSAMTDEVERQKQLETYLGRSLCLKIIECKRGLRRVVFSERAALAQEGQRKQIFNTLKVGDVVEGTVTNITEFGAFIDLGGVEGLIHLSELSWGRVHHPSEIVKIGQKLRAQVLKVCEKDGRVAMSLKQLTPNPWLIISRQYKVGDILPATIKTTTNYGVFAVIKEGIEGLIHISLISLPPGVDKCEDYLHPGQPVQVQILSIDPNRRRLSLKLANPE